MTHPTQDTREDRAHLRRNLLLIASYLAIMLLIAGVYAS
jgi:hypothetical protein